MSGAPPESVLVHGCSGDRLFVITDLESVVLWSLLGPSQSFSAMLGHVSEGACPDCSQPLAQVGDRGICPDCLWSWKVTGKQIQAWPAPDAPVDQDAWPYWQNETTEERP
jgi:hypothetical protein